MHKIWDLAIIGAGASGLAAAVEAARGGAEVIVIEKNNVIGRKILSTGAGKCNFSNKHISASDYNTEAQDFLQHTFKALCPSEILNFFSNLGLLYTTGENGKLFPRSLKAKDIVAILETEAKFNGVLFRTLCVADKITYCANADYKFLIEVKDAPAPWSKKAVPHNSENIFAKNVLIASGSQSCPRIGGSFLGYDLLKSLGHKISHLFPVITPLNVKEKFVKDIDGVRLNANIKFLCEERPIAQASGELLFTKNGISGPVVLDCARAVLLAVKNNSAVKTIIDIFPDYDYRALHNILVQRLDKMGGKSFHAFALGLHNEKIINLFASLSGIKMENKVCDIKPEVFAAFEHKLKNFELEIAGAPNFDEAAASAGGVELAEINPITFVSYKMDSLYITGECLNVDGRSGGFNLHFAWTSGILAARAILKSLKK